MTHQKIIPINVDRNVSFADYRPFEEKKQLLVSSMFYTYQGEGPFQGHPAVFLRLAGCNLGAKEDCPFCDTRFDFDKGVVWNTKELAAELHRLGAGKAKVLVVTGGEPLLQQTALSDLFNWLGVMRDATHHASEASLEIYQVETNGYFLKQNTFEAVAEDVHIVISPKVAATRGEYNRPRDSWFFGESHEPNITTYLKYVLSADPASPYHTVPSDVLRMCRESETPLYVSGMAVYLKSYPEDRISSIWHTDEIDQTATAENYRYTAQYALMHGLRVSYQSHLFGAVP